MKLYFAHPITDYGTARQRDAIRRLREVFPVSRVVSPDTPEHAEAYKRLGSMDYFINLVATCDALAFLRFPNDKIGAGVAKEMECAFRLALPVYEVRGRSVLRQLQPDSTADSVLTVDETRALIKELSL